MFGADKGTADRLDGKKLHIGIVQARFNESITNALAAGLPAELLALGVQEKHITHVLVPGALEVPVALQAMAESDEYDALIALGCIIRGETYHFELVANESGAASRASRWTTTCPLPTPSSPPKTWTRPSPARPKRAATRPAWPWKWPTCWTSCHERRQTPPPTALRPPSKAAPA
jgi:6,7-dimethyl-8-ribityllumazine synthase